MRYEIENIPKEVASLLLRLENKGYAAYIVGGAVRDVVLQAKVSDWDLVTNASIPSLLELFSDLHCLSTGLKHGTITVVLDGKPIEISTFRGAEPTLYADLAKRDFTINALAYSKREGLIDYFGGVEDCEAKKVRAVLNAEERFKEDPLRVLRALRFASVYAMEITPDTELALNKVSMAAVATERICTEMTKLLMGRNVLRVLCAYAPVLVDVLPEILPMKGLQQYHPYHRFDVLTHTAYVVAHSPEDPVLRWAALFHDIGKPDTFSLDEQGIGHFYEHPKESLRHARTIMERLHFSCAWQEEIEFLVRYHGIDLPEDMRGTKKLLQKMGVERLEKLLALKEADGMGFSVPCREKQLATVGAFRASMAKAIEENGCFTRKDLAVSGHDLIRLGFRGKEIGDMLEHLVREVVFNGLENTQECLLSMARQGVGSGPKETDGPLS